MGLFKHIEAPIQAYRCIRCMRSIVHAGDILPSGRFNYAAEMQEGKLESLRFYCQDNYKRKCLTRT